MFCFCISPQQQQLQKSYFLYFWNFLYSPDQATSQSFTSSMNSFHFFPYHDCMFLYKNFFPFFKIFDELMPSHKLRVELSGSHSLHFYNICIDFLTKRRKLFLVCFKWSNCFTLGKLTAMRKKLEEDEKRVYLR